MTITHSTPADGTFSASGATAWDAAHTIAANTITEAMLSLSNNSTANVSTTAHGFAPILPNDSSKFLDGTGAYSTPSASVTLNGISAATGSVTIASGNNTGIVWNWANTSNSTVAFTFGETSAATNGTSTSGVPNQVLLKLTTLASSTMSPLSVYSRGSHVFSVSPTTTQIVLADGSAGAPTLCSSGLGSGFYTRAGGSFAAISSLGTEVFGVYTNSGPYAYFFAGTAARLAITDLTSANTGFYWPATNTVAVSNVTTGEICRFVGGTSGVGYMTFSAVTFANLPAATNGSLLYCSDCDPASAIDQTCTSAGAKTGAFAARVNGAWKCYT